MKLQGLIHVYDEIEGINFDGIKVFDTNGKEIGTVTSSSISKARMVHIECTVEENEAFQKMTKHYKEHVTMGVKNG